MRSDARKRVRGPDGGSVSCAQRVVQLGAEIERLTAALAEAERERDEAREQGTKLADGLHVWRDDAMRYKADAEQAERRACELPEQIAQAIGALFDDPDAPNEAKYAYEECARIARDPSHQGRREPLSLRVPAPQVEEPPDQQGAAMTDPITPERVTLTDAERETLDERVAGDWWGYYIHFEPTGLPEVDRLLSAVGLAGKMYHHTDMWNEDDANYGPIREGESPVDFIQRAANDATARVSDRLHEAKADAWDKGWQAGNDDYDQGTETPNPYRETPHADDSPVSYQDCSCDPMTGVPCNEHA